MTTNHYDLISKSGNDSVYEVTLLDNTGNILDLSDAEGIEAQCRTRSNIYLFDFEVSIVDPVNGLIRLVINGNDTVDIFGVYFWDIRLIYQQGVQHTQTGTIHIRQAKTIELV